MPHKVLFVDDEPNVTQGLKNILRKESYEILRAESGDEALKMLAEQDVDVIVSDERMPGMSGTDLLKLVKAKYPQTIRIMLTGQASPQAAFTAITEGQVYRFLIKPCNGLDMAITIRKALEYKELLKRVEALIVSHREKAAILDQVEKRHPGSTKSKNTVSALDPNVIWGDYRQLLKVMDGELGIESQANSNVKPDSKSAGGAAVSSPTVSSATSTVKADSPPVKPSAVSSAVSPTKSEALKPAASVSPPVAPKPVSPVNESKPVAAEIKAPNSPIPAKAESAAAEKTPEIQYVGQSVDPDGQEHEGIQNLKPIMPRSDIYEKLDSCEELKGMSPTVAQLVQMTRNPRCSIDHVVKIVRQDYAVSLKVLKIANSVIYTRGEPVDTIHRAVMRIGLNQIRQAVLNISVVDQFSENKHETRLNTPKFWEHSIATGLITTEIFRSFEASDVELDSAFTMGLLHDVGRYVYLDVLGEKYLEVLEAADRLCLPLEQVETRMLLINHADAMDRILHKWSFSKDLVNPIALHQLSLGNIRRIAPRAVQEVATLSLANRLSHALLLGSSGNPTLYPTEEYATTLKLKPDLIRNIQENIPGHTDDFKFSLLATTDQRNWPRMVDEMQEQLGTPFRPLCVVAEPDYSSVRIFCDSLRTIDYDDDREEKTDSPPNIAVVYIRNGSERVPLTEKLKQAEAQAGVESLPVLIFSPKGDLCLENRAMFGRHSQQLPIPVRFERILKAIKALLAPVPVGARS